MLEANKKILYLSDARVSWVSLPSNDDGLSMWLIVPHISIPYFAHTVYSIASATNIVTLNRKLVCVCTVDYRWGQCTREHFAWPKVFFVRLCLKYISQQSRFFYMANRWNLRVFYMHEHSLKICLPLLLLPSSFTWAINFMPDYLWGLHKWSVSESCLWLNSNWALKTPYH